MAVYEYQCRECKATFTITERISSHAQGKRRPACPECKSRKTERLFSRFFAKTSSKA